MAWQEWFSILSYALCLPPGSGANLAGIPEYNLFVTFWHSPFPTPRIIDFLLVFASRTDDWNNTKSHIDSSTQLLAHGPNTRPTTSNKLRIFYCLLTRLCVHAISHVIFKLNFVDHINLIFRVSHATLRLTKRHPINRIKMSMIMFHRRINENTKINSDTLAQGSLMKWITCSWFNIFKWNNERPNGGQRIEQYRHGSLFHYIFYAKHKWMRYRTFAWQ